jgi:tellurite resistance protein
MFADRLNDAEKQMLANLLMHLSKVDNVIKKKELSHLFCFSQQHNVNMEIDLDIPLGKVCQQIERLQAKVIILQELIWAARIDGDFCQEEENFIRKVMEYFGIDQLSFQDIDFWVKEGMSWMDKGEDMIENLVHKVAY